MWLLLEPFGTLVWNFRDLRCDFDAFNVSLETQNTLTAGQSVGGVITVDATQVDKSLCGL